MLIDESYFTGPLSVAQLGKTDVVDSLKRFIEIYEPLVMEAALGYDFYQSFKTGLAAGSIEQRWLNLRDGFMFNNIQTLRQRFVGFGNSTTKISPIAGIVYYEYMRDMASTNTGIGLVADKSENASPANPVRKPVDAFNTAVFQLRSFWELMQADQNLPVKIYPEFNPQLVTAYWSTGKTFFGFTFYTGSEVYSLRCKNVFGI